MFLLSSAELHEALIEGQWVCADNNGHLSKVKVYYNYVNYTTNYNSNINAIGYYVDLRGKNALSYLLALN